MGREGDAAENGPETGDRNGAATPGPGRTRRRRAAGRRTKRPAQPASRTGRRGDETAVEAETTESHRFAAPPTRRYRPVQKGSFMHVASRRVGVLASLAAAVVTTLLTGCDWHIVGSSSASAGGAVASQLFPPVVRYTGRAPTGYTVTFRYEDPKATSVQVQGEWYFSSPAATTTTSSQGLLPSQWRPGDFPIGWPNTGVTAGWPVVEMKRDPRTGVWSYTTPLPSGEFNYWFFVNCPNPGGTGCTGVSDPSNPPWNDRHGLTTGSVEPTSQVYVPSDPAFHTVDYWWQAPTSPRGALVDVTYPMSAKPTREFPGMHYLAVYTPPGYDQHRSTPYPSLYLSAGARGNEVEWSTRADAASILDNFDRQGRGRAHGRGDGQFQL